MPLAVNPIAPMSLKDFRRFTAKFTIGDGCWEWKAYKNSKGYGQFYLDKKRPLAHRVAYTEFVGPVPVELVLDHRCLNPSCVRPSHLEPVTNDENLERGTGRKRTATHCAHGHEWAVEGYYRKNGTLTCHECDRIRARESYHRRKKG